LKVLPANDLSNDVSAVIAIKKLERLKEIQEERQRKAAHYDELLFWLPEDCKFVDVKSPYRYTIRVKNAQKISEQMKAKGICCELPVYDYGCPDDLIESKRAFSEILSLPFYPSITLEEQKQVVTTLKGVLNEI